ncbi:MAG: FliH/SctL family protein [Nitrospinota bacterium]
MSKVIFEPEEGSYKSFSLETFSGAAEETEKKKKDIDKEFKPDRMGPKEREFVMGGFDFEYSGGYRKDEIMKKTTDEIENMLLQAKENAKQTEKDGFDKGYKEGHDKGSEDGLKEATSLMESLKEALNSLMNVRRSFYEKNEKEMVDLISRAVGEIVYRETFEGGDIIADIIRNAVKDLHAKQFIKIRLNPVDMEMAQKLEDELIKSIDEVEGVEMKEDPAVSPGGCIIESNIGELDATLETRLRAMHEKISGSVG